MAETSGIAWTRSTFNPWIGCTKVGPGCDHCYAESEDARKRWGGAAHWGPGVPRHRTSESYWRMPLQWNALAYDEVATGKIMLRPTKRWKQQEPWAKPGFWPVFCASLADVFDNEVPQEWRDDLWNLIESTPNLTWQIVTKRIGNVAKMVPESWMRDGFPLNVWMIATVVNQEEFDRDWPKLRALPAYVRGLSIEPMLGRIYLPDDVDGWLHWAIYGGESTQTSGQAREFRLWWAEDGIAQCRFRKVAPFIKQLGTNATVEHPYPAGAVEQLPFGRGKRDDPDAWPKHLRVREFPR